MRTGPSWTEPVPHRSLRSPAAALRSVLAGVEDLTALIAFRRSGTTEAARRRVRIGSALALGLTVLAVALPAWARGPLQARHAGDLVAVLPSFYLGFALLSILAAVSSGGGREVVPREQTVAYPVGTLAEHLGALLLAPLNIAWLIQAWALLGATAYTLGPRHLALAIVPVLLWILAATAVGQLGGWWFEGVRRGPRGTVVARLLTAGVAGALAALVASGRTAGLLDHSPTVWVYLAASYATTGAWGSFLVAVATLIALVVALVLAGAVPARWALHRPQREELRLESGNRAARPDQRSDLGAMMRIDRASVWRSVPLRRGLLVLALMPGAVSLAGELSWDLITILPGLVASGGALLFGVNAWCLDGRGALWRDSLPVDPRTAYVAKAVVLLEVLLAAAGLTIALAAVRAGQPTRAELASVVMVTLVVSVQVVATTLRWSVLNPYAVDLRSARATPAPPVVMAGYSARLALRTTFVGLVFSGTGLASDWRVAVVVALPLLCWSAFGLVRTGRAWTDPLVRARVVAVVAG